ncbi:MAG: hypothetical protein KGS61_15890 [Verrucomicrobia bacterium]|nr:hypothetical protein [Verrucomicrobiota bacterium]
MRFENMIGSRFKRFFEFVALGLLLAAPGEVLNQILARHDVRAFRATLVSYSGLLFVGYFVGGGLTRLIREPARAMTVYYVMFGCFGLAVEWLLLGNAPVADPLQLITQPGMFSYWGTMLLGPRLITHPAGSGSLRRRFLGFFSGFSAAYLGVALLVPRDHGGIFFGFITFAAGNVWLNSYYLAYIKALQASSADARRAAVAAGPSPAG